MIRRGVTIFSNHSPPSELASPHALCRSMEYSTRPEPTFARNVLAGKRLDTYISPSADFWASRVYYLDTYTVNLKSDDNFTIFYDLVLFAVGGHPVTGQPTQGLLYILWLIFP